MNAKDLDLSTDLLLDPDGAVHKLKGPKNQKAYILEEMQAMVKGYVEVIPGCPFSSDHIGIANEEGLLHDFEYNENASTLFGIDLVGPIAILRADRMS